MNRDGKGSMMDERQVQSTRASAASKRPLHWLALMAVIAACATTARGDELFRRLPPLLEPVRTEAPTLVVFPEQITFQPVTSDNPIQLTAVRQPLFESSQAAENRIRFTQPAVALANPQEPVTPRRAPAEDEHHLAPAPGSEPQAPAGDDSSEDSEEKKKDEPEKLGRAPQNNAMQFLRTESVLLKPGAWQFDTGLDYTLFDDDFPVAFFNGGGLVTDVAEGRFRQRLLFTPLAFRYGVCENVQAFVAMPIGYSNTQTSIIGDSVSSNSGGIGDLTAGSTFLLWQGDGEYCPDVIATITATAPTGDFDAPILGVIPGSALGQGFWATSANLLFIHQYDPVTVFYGAGYRHMFERSFQGIDFQPGEQISYQFGVGFSVNDRVTLSATLQGFYLTEVLQDNLVIQGTNLEPISLRFAATIARCERILEPFAQVGMTDSAPQASLGITVTLY